MEEKTIKRKRGDEPAYPVHDGCSPSGDGMTIRERFTTGNTILACDNEDAARAATILADATLAELKDND